MKIIYKPWGKEEWLEINEYYCYKRIYINKGHKTSYQYHEEKIETNYIISGHAEVWLENDNGVVEILQMKDGDFFNVKPLKKHRVIAKTDIILQEVSTPQVDDVIRISDDTNRDNGKIENEHLKPAFCIVSSGKGTRMYHLTENINKALLPINGKAVISHIIDKVPKEYDIIITTGYKSETLKEYCEAAHEERNITFVNVPDYDSEYSGPGASLLQCKHLLQRPFYFSTVDCLIKDNLPSIDSDWIGVSPTSIPELYSTAQLDEDQNVINFKNKSKNGYEFAFIGLSAIYNYNIFWNTLLNNIGNTGELVSVYMQKNSNFVYKVKAKNIDWYDTGTIDSYHNIKQLIEKNYFVLDKKDEFFYNLNDKIIKIFVDKKTCKNRIKRSEILKDYIPTLTYKGENTYAYKKVIGQTLYEVDDFNIFIQFLNYIEKFWKYDYIDLSEESKKFYYEKTYKRIDKFLEKYPNINELEHTIDGIKCKSLDYYLNEIDFYEFDNCLPSKTFHGDLQFDNIIYDGNTFKLIDWRQSFGDSTTHGDIYYDLAKLYGGILISYYDMKKNNFSFDVVNNDIKLNYEPSKNLKLFKSYYEKWLVNNGYDLHKVKTLTFLIYLNMSPLHDEPFDLFLFYFAKKLIETNDN
jgi:NDP-sugar pyrophosphorylase family protein/mannose-6-phosphate isomerase-like protein (cupin superfamily)